MRTDPELTLTAILVTHLVIVAVRFVANRYTIRRATAALILLVLPCAVVAVAGTMEDELRLPDMAAFSIGIDVNIKSVRSLDADSLNVLLDRGRKDGREWAAGPAAVVLHFAGEPMSTEYRQVECQGWPTEGRPRIIRATFTEHGYEDDSCYGQRLVMWFARDPADGSLTVRRALWAQRCQRAYWRFYSADSCP